MQAHPTATPASTLVCDPAGIAMLLADQLLAPADRSTAL